MQITNTQPGPRGINTVIGPVLVEPGQTIEAKVYAREREHIEASRWFELDGDFEADPDTGNAGQVTVTNSDGKDGVYIPSNEFNAMRDAFESQTNELSRLQSENDDLRNQLAALQAGSSQNDGNQPKGPFEVKETAPGWFGIFGADGQQIGKNVREADAETFKGLTAEEQEKYLAP